MYIVTSKDPYTDIERYLGNPCTTLAEGKAIVSAHLLTYEHRNCVWDNDIDPTNANVHRLFVTSMYTGEIVDIVKVYHV